MSGSLVPSTPSPVELSSNGDAVAGQNWGPPSPPPAPGPVAVNIGRYISALKRYKWLIAAIVLVGTIGGVIATRFIPPTYQVDTTIVVGESPDPKGPVRPQVVLNEQAWKELLMSFA